MSAPLWLQLPSEGHLRGVRQCSFRTCGSSNQPTGALSPTWHAASCHRASRAQLPQLTVAQPQCMQGKVWRLLSTPLPRRCGMPSSSSASSRLSSSGGCRGAPTAATPLLVQPPPLPMLGRAPPTAMRSSSPLPQQQRGGGQGAPLHSQAGQHGASESMLCLAPSSGASGTERRSSHAA